MAENLIKKAILKKQIEGALYEVMLKTTAEMVVVDEAGTTLAAKLLELGKLPTNAYVDQKVSELVDGAPETLDTLKELAAALGSDPNFATTIATQLGGKVDKVAGKGLSTNDYDNAAKTKLAGIAEGANKTTLVNNLTTTSTGSALDATQGKALNDTLSGHTGNTTVHVTAAERTAWNGKGRIIAATTAPADLTENDLYLELLSV